MAQTVPTCAHLTVGLTRVSTQTDRVVVPQDGRVIIVPLVSLSLTIKKELVS